jgi:hypothetical protein
LSLASVVALSIGSGSGAGAAAGDQAFITKACSLPKVWLTRLENGYRPDWSGDVIMVPPPQNIVDGGYSHSGPYDHLQNVPLFFYAPGIVKPGVYNENAYLTDIAPTTGAVMKFPFKAPDGRPLTDALLPADQRQVPKLFVTVVWDAGGQDVLHAWPQAWTYLKSLSKQGAWFPHAYVGSSPSNTPPGHAEIGTGAFPRHNGFVDEYVRLNGHTVQPTQAGPGLLLEPTFGDLYDIAHQNKPIVGALATLAAHDLMMSHGSFFNGGDKDIAIMRQVENAATGGAESVSWNLVSTMAPYYTFPKYINDLPDISKYNDALDQQDGKKDGLWRTHSIEQLRTGFDTPARTPYQESIVRSVIQQEGFGADAVPDLLYINYKAIDTTEHLYSLNSPEMMDTVAANDAALKDLVDFLNKQVGKGQWAMALTADHGSQYSAAVAGGAPIDPTKVRDLLDAKFDTNNNGVDLFTVVRPSEIWFETAEAAALHVTPEAVASFLQTMTVAQASRSYYNIPPGHETDQIYQAVFPSRILTGLPCLPASVTGG